MAPCISAPARPSAGPTRSRDQGPGNAHLGYNELILARPATRSQDGDDVGSQDGSSRCPRPWWVPVPGRKWCDGHVSTPSLYGPSRPPPRRYGVTQDLSWESSLPLKPRGGSPRSGEEFASRERQRPRCSSLTGAGKMLASSLPTHRSSQIAHHNRRSMTTWLQAGTSWDGRGWTYQDKLVLRFGWYGPWHSRLTKHPATWLHVAYIAPDRLDGRSIHLRIRQRTSHSCCQEPSRRLRRYKGREWELWRIDI